MAKVTVRVTGTSPVWADIEVEAESVEEALAKVRESDPRFTADWQLSEGNGVNDWDVSEVFDEDGEEIEDEVEAKVCAKCREPIANMIKVVTADGGALFHGRCWGG